MRTTKGYFRLVPLLLLALAGCGGHDHQATAKASPSATLKMNVVWPSTNARLVPNASNSLVAVVLVKGQEVARTLAVRPGAVHASNSGSNSSSTTILLENLPAGEATVTMASYPSTDGTGTAQAKGSTTETLVAGQTTNDSTSMSSTVATLSIAPVTGALPTMAMGDSVTFDVSARDAANDVVLLQSNQSVESLTWTSDNVAATVNGLSGDVAATVTGVSQGTANVTASLVVDDAGHTVTASAPVTVTQAVIRSLAIGGSPTVAPGHNDSLTATAIYSDGSTMDVTSQVTWAATAPGSITAAGVFSATTSGNSTVTATLGEVSQTTTITVAPLRVIQLLVTPDTALSSTPQDVQFKAVATYEDNTTEDVTSQVNWICSTPGRGGSASINLSGLFHWDVIADPSDDYCYVQATYGGLNSGGRLIQYYPH